MHTLHSGTANVIALMSGPQRTSRTTIANFVAGRAPKNDPALFALAVAATPAFGSQETAQYALSWFSKLARPGTHHFHFTEYLNSMRGWGRSVKNAVSAWYLSKNPDQLAYRLVKYQSRGGWSHKDVLKLAHSKTDDQAKAAILAWSVVGGVDALKFEADDWTCTPKAKKNGQRYIVTARETDHRRD